MGGLPKLTRAAAMLRVPPMRVPSPCVLHIRGGGRLDASPAQADGRALALVAERTSSTRAAPLSAPGVAACAGYLAIIIFDWLVVVANYLEAKEVTSWSKVWITLFSLFSLLVPILGQLNFSAYDQAACERASVSTPREAQRGFAAGLGLARHA